MKTTLAIAVVLLGGGEFTKFDYSAAGRIVILHEGRMKPLDSFARELMRTVTGKERFSSYRDPKSGERVEVFGDSAPVAAVLRLIADPEKFRTVRFIRVDHPALKAKYGLEAERVFFSIQDFDACRDQLHRDGKAFDSETATSAERAVLELLKKEDYIQAVMQERLLAIVPIPFGKTGGWMTPGDLEIYFSGVHPTDPRYQALREALDAFIKGDPSGARDKALRGAVDAYRRLKAALAKGESGAFNSAAAELAATLKTVNPQEYPTDKEIDRELWYRQMKPFSWSAGFFGLAFLFFVGSWVFGSREFWVGALVAQAAGIGMTAYGYGLRWLIAERYPLSNHYESMIMVAFSAAIVSTIAEVLQRRRVFGLAGATVACLMIVLADTVPIFASQSAISNLVPALQTFWMTIHVPVIMTGYAGAAIICVLGHIYLFMYLFRRESPEKAGELERLDSVMYRALQVTVLFLLSGILLGAVWAGEAWGRPWGWDMKETWALIVLIGYIAMLHGRFTGYVRGLGTALGSLVAFALVILCYYGVNFIFGKGLHYYGFGSGEILPVILFFAAEALLMGAAIAAWIRRRPPVPPELIRE
jgi:cytochrome c-type biogenesis protein CcsB